MHVELAKLIIALIVLWFSSEILIYASKKLAVHFGISETFIGLTILSIGTTLPELGTHIVSSLLILEGHDVSGITLGANIGSNLFQITVILGIVGLLMNVRSTRNFLETHYVAMLISIVLLFVYGLDGSISRAEGVVLAILYLLYLWYIGEVEHFVDKIEHHPQIKDPKHRVMKPIILIPIGIALLLFAAKVAVDNAGILAGLWGVSDSLVGALILGIGTALPELTVAIAALRQHSSGMSLGVLVGSNITNPLFGVGIGAAISTYSIPPELWWFDVPVWFGLSLLPMFFFWKKNDLGKWKAALLILAYVAYVIVRLKLFAHGL